MVRMLIDDIYTDTFLRPLRHQWWSHYGVQFVTVAPAHLSCLTRSGEPPAAGLSLDGVLEMIEQTGSRMPSTGAS
jgi:hypothetical protein